MNTPQTPESLTVKEAVEQTHDTMVVGLHSGKIVFFKSFHYASQKEEAQATLTHVEAEYPDGWIISHLGHWSLENLKDGDIHDFKIAFP